MALVKKKTSWLPVSKHWNKTCRDKVREPALFICSPHNSPAFRSLVTNGRVSLWSPFQMLYYSGRENIGREEMDFFFQRKEMKTLHLARNRNELLEEEPDQLRRREPRAGVWPGMLQPIRIDPSARPLRGGRGWGGAGMLSLKVLRSDKSDALKFNQKLYCPHSTVIFQLLLCTLVHRGESVHPHN